MVEQLLALILVGLGIQTPSIPPAVLGDDDVVQAATGTAEISPTKKVEDRRTGNTVSEAARKINADPKAAREGAQEELKNLQEKFKLNAASRSAYIDERKDMREKFTEEIKAKREEAIAAFKTQRDSFKKRVETIKDEKKKDIVENMDTRLTEVNTKQTTQMSDTLNRMDEILTKLSGKVAELKAEGKDVAAAESALSQAQSSVTAARGAVTTQAGKEYVIGITSENNLKTDVGRAMQSLEKDLKTTRETVNTARQSIQKVIQALALIK